MKLGKLQKRNNSEDSDGILIANHAYSGHAQSQKKKVDDERALFIFRDSIEAILEILESYEKLQERFVSAVGKVNVKHFNRSRF